MEAPLLITHNGTPLGVAAQDAPSSAWESVRPPAHHRLPSIDELEGMYHQLHAWGLGNFQPAVYWSGSAFNDTVAWYFDFRTGTDGTALKRFTCHVRFVSNTPPAP
ncbi:MAG: hypothetical protein R2817_00750 [Flavobacteriales bacterium]